MRPFAYLRPSGLAEAQRALAEPGSRPMGGGTDLLTQIQRGIGDPVQRVVDLRGLDLAGIVTDGDGIRIGATTTIADLAADRGVCDRFAVLGQAAAGVASTQIREMGTVAGNLCQHVRCWYYRHPDLRCWLRGGDTCYAQIGDHRKHGLEPGDCISVAPSDLAAALLALNGRVETSSGRELPIADLYRRATEQQRSTIALEPGELLTAVRVPEEPLASAYVRAGERAAWSFALAAVAAVRFGDGVRLAAIGVSNLPRRLDPDDPLAGLPGLEMTGWKRRLLATLVDDALAAIR